MKKLFTLLLILSPVLFFCWSMPGAKAADRKEGLAKERAIDSYKVIRVHSYGGISPKVLNIKPGTIVIWVNNSRSEISIQFGGKQVTLACKSQVHFVLDDQGSYIADRIPQDAVASLCFVEKGEFNYVTRGAYSETGDKDLKKIKEYKGKIVVE
jgi:plastocyanin